jgi:hypothetical protein
VPTASLGWGAGALEAKRRRWRDADDGAGCDGDAISNPLVISLQDLENGAPANFDDACVYIIYQLEAVNLSCNSAWHKLGEICKHHLRCIHSVMAFAIQVVYIVCWCSG